MKHEAPFVVGIDPGAGDFGVCVLVLLKERQPLRIIGEIHGRSILDGDKRSKARREHDG